MAKPLGPKSLLIRDAIKAHPDKGNTELADTINASPARKDDKIEVTAGDVAQQKQALKKAAEATEPEAAPAAKEAPTKKRGRPAGKQAKKKAAAPTANANGTSPVTLIDGVFSLAGQCGGMGELKRLVDRLAESPGQ